jgi:hypothetical protein
LIEGIACLIISVTGIMIGVTPGNNERWLSAVASHPGLSIATYGIITGIADLALIPGALALYVALKDIRKTAMLIAAGILLSYVAIDLSTFVANAIAITTLTQSLASATDATQQMVIRGAEYFGLATIPMSQFFGWFFPSFGYLIAALVIREGKLGKVTVILGILASITDIAGSFAFLSPGSYWESFLTPGLFLLGLFGLSAGIMLIRLSGQRRMVATAP